MDANAIVHSLVYERIIANSDLTNITSNPDLRQRNEILHACLLRTCNEKALMKVCEIIVEQGYPTMKELGENMKSMLEGRCYVHVFINHSACINLHDLVPGANRCQAKS